MDFDAITEQILERIDIVDIISRYVNLKKAGKNYKGLCPFHTEKTPSFSVSPDKQIFKCFGCGKGGNAIHFIMEYEKLPFMDTLKLLAKEAHIDLNLSTDYNKDEKTLLLNINKDAAFFFKQEFGKAPERIKEYLSKRGLRQATLDKFGIGFAPDQWEKLVKYLSGKKYPLAQAEKLGLLSVSRLNKYIDRFRNRIMFPIHDLAGNTVGFGGRTTDNNKETAKYINSPESLIYHKSNILYGLFFSKNSIKEKNSVIFVEGYLDVLQLFQNGIENVVASSGTAFTEQQARLIRRFTDNIYLCYDADKAGLNAVMKAGLMITDHEFNVKVILLPEGEDPDSFVLNKGAGAFTEQINNALPFEKFFIHYYSTVFDLKDFRQRQQALKQAVAVLGEMKNALLADYLIEELAFVADSSPVTLKNTLNDLRKHKHKLSSVRKSSEPTKTNPPENRATETAPLPPMERDILVLLLQNDPAINGMILSEIQVTSFTHPDLRKLYGQICDLYDDTGCVDSKVVLTAIKNESVLNEITKKMMEEFVNPFQYAKDTLLKLQYRNIRLEKEKLALQIKKEQEKGEVNGELIDRLQKILVKMKEIGKRLNEH